MNAYAAPVVEQAVNQLVQVTPLEQVNEKIHEITELVRGHLQDFLAIYGITLNDVKVLIRPSDERMRELISLRAFGLSELDAVRYYVALKMAERGLFPRPTWRSASRSTTASPVSLRCQGWTPEWRPGAAGPAQLGHRLSGPMAGALGDRLRSLLASDVYRSKGGLRADDLHRIRELMGERSRYLEIQA